ncbi:MAG TPA: hypothetical protein DDX39_01485 [Bacteroidales bacterium]|nr:MAG: hypothetical protein A2W98_07700 [Bacteroidetes bacterium GWF2_33_38]OFY88107.1 MAG: hypothetical protein A2236_13000 [Bacteroidetes bacterium RIFOXYA2_FULL_33_7]HBF87284.1 hypothetical protein [Bacteroidales bacterium]
MEITSELIIEIIGYLGSIVFALSMWMTSIFKMRWAVLIGNLIFIGYGFFIDSPPIYLLNTLNATVNIYFLYKIYTKKEYFKLLEVRNDNLYLINFLDYYRKEINKFFPFFTYKPEKNTLTLLVLRNMFVAGVFLARKIDDETLMMSLDFAIPEYRDFKMGRYIYGKHCEFFKKLGYKKIYTISLNHYHEKYLVKMGFFEDHSRGERLFLKKL